jgi:hypothetical protein
MTWVKERVNIFRSTGNSIFEKKNVRSSDIHDLVLRGEYPF